MKLTLKILKCTLNHYVVCELRKHQRKPFFLKSIDSNSIYIYIYDWDLMWDFLSQQMRRQEMKRQEDPLLLPDSPLLSGNLLVVNYKDKKFPMVAIRRFI